jgi:hypothetical protein
MLERPPGLRTKLRLDGWSGEKRKCLKIESLSLSLSLSLSPLLLVDFLFFEFFTIQELQKFRNAGIVKGRNSSKRDENSRIAAETENGFRVVVGVFKGFEEDGGRILLE